MTLALRWVVVRAILLFHYGIDTEIWVSTESWPWRRIVFCRSWWDSNPQPFKFESSALPLSYPRFITQALSDLRHPSKPNHLPLSNPRFITQALTELRHPSKPNHPHKYREEEKHGTEFLKTHYLGLFLPFQLLNQHVCLYILLFQTGTALEWQCVCVRMCMCAYVRADVCCVCVCVFVRTWDLFVCAVD